MCVEDLDGFVDALACNRGLGFGGDLVMVGGCWVGGCGIWEVFF